MKRTAYPSLLLLTLTLAACGGGSGDDATLGTETMQATTSVADNSDTAPAVTLDLAAESTSEAGFEAEPEAAPESAAADAPAPDSMIAAADNGTTVETDAAVPATDPASADAPAEPTRMLATTTAITPLKHLYVATTGNDSNPGTQAAPFKTILRASKVATANTTVHVAPGTYAGGFTTTSKGSASGRIRYVSDVKWGAKIVPAAGTTARVAWSERGSYVDIDGFDVDGRSGQVWRNGLVTFGSYNVIKNNHVHHIADKVPCDNMGGSAINTTHYNYGVKDDVIGNVVHHIGYTGCKFIQGIYIGTSGSVKNNLVYQIGKNAIQSWHDATNIIIANNTIFKSDYGIVVGGGDFYHNTIHDNTHVSNNIVFDNVRGIEEVGTVGNKNTYTNNLLFRNSYRNIGLKGGKTHTGTIVADPQLVNYQPTGGGDYRPRSTSPAVNKGRSTYAPPNDIIGTARPQFGAFDIGAYEHR
ncbi:choice-of-anchor Q domain-containing protein [Noviherbaspirillum sp.]|uniref:choice-of-anchor Q domain-containing protein n=1 Tax=Noviherbaspirillum sp. TaxID=1926288 RepID=UPI002FE32FB1